MTTPPPGFTSGYADVNETKLYYEMAGTGAPVVLLHGLSLDTRMWDGQFATLAADYRVVRYDARGHGKSVPAPDAPYSNSEDLCGLLDCLAIERAHLVGLSMGGRTVIDFIVDNPDRALSLVPVDAAFGGFHPITNIRDRLGVIITTANDISVDAALDLWMADELFGPAVDNPVSAGPLKEIVGAYSGWHWTSGVKGLDSDQSAIQSLGSISVPTLVIVGELDLPDFRATADVMAEKIPGASKVVMPGVGHMSNMEDPAGFNTILRDFLSRIR